MLNTFVQRLRTIWPFVLMVVLASAMLLFINSGDHRGSSASQTVLEARLEAILSDIDGAGRVRVMVTEDDVGNALGAVIISDRHLSVQAYLNIQSAAHTLLGIELEHIRIIGRAGWTEED